MLLIALLAAFVVLPVGLALPASSTHATYDYDTDDVLASTAAHGLASPTRLDAVEAFSHQRLTDGAARLPPGRDLSAPNRVIVDTNAVYDRPGTIGALRPGEVPVVTRTTPAEIANNAAAGKLKPPGFLNELDVIDDVMDVNTRINIRSQLDALRPGQRGLFGDGSIGATAINTGSPVVTADKNLARVLESMGVEVRRP